MAKRSGVPRRPASAVTTPLTPTMEPSGCRRASPIASGGWGDGNGDGRPVAVGDGDGEGVALGSGDDTVSGVGDGLVVGDGVVVGGGVLVGRIMSSPGSVANSR